jgi:hypothetical protein
MSIGFVFVVFWGEGCGGGMGWGAFKTGATVPS